MLKFMRNKLVGIEIKDENRYLVHGTLDDDIYALEIDVLIDMKHLEILDINGRWRRWTTAECPRAVPMLKEAIGLRIGDDFHQVIRRTVGKKSCRHFANLLVDCCDTARAAYGFLDTRHENRDLEDAPHGLSIHSKPSGFSLDEVSNRDKTIHGKQDPGDSSSRMVIDIHMHSSPASPCSSVTVDHLIEEAKRVGLDGICLTDHNYVWKEKDVEDLRNRHDFFILRGNEITTDQGDILVFGLEEDVKGIIPIEELRVMVDEADGVMVAAHPFRGFVTVDFADIGLTPDKAIERPLFRYVDAVEVLNGKVTESENRFTDTVADMLGLPKTGGSDAHERSEVGRYATMFFDKIRNESDLVAAIKEGRCKPVAFRE